MKARARDRIFQKHTSPETVGMLQFVTNAGESQWAFDSPAVWSSNIWIRNELNQRTGFIVYGRWTRDGDEDRRIKAWIWVCSSQSYGFWRSGLQHTNKIVSFRNYVAVLVFFMVLLSVTACRRKRCFLWPMANKVNITWQVKVKRFQMLFILRCKVKSCLTLCNC